jgi:DNA mismatch repair protein MutS2
MEVFPSSAPERLGFDIIRDRVGRLLQSDQARDRYASEEPQSDPERVRAELDRVTELQQMLKFDDPFPLEAVADIRRALRAAAPDEAYLDPADLVAIADWLGVCRRVKAYVSRRSSAYPLLAPIVLRLPSHGGLEERIQRSIGPDGRVSDSASPELGRIRSGIHQREAQLRSTLLRELRAAIGSGFATEEQPTVRNGRMVIPVRAEARRKIAGFVHDTSSSGQTVYLEPAACLDLNNEIRELQAAERREVERILRSITAEVRSHLVELRDGVDALAMIDVLHARAIFANQLDATVPDLSTDGVVDLIGARNPVLSVLFRDQKETARNVVPLDLRLGESFNTLIITGPNAGGKTVAMKTIGLFALMLAYGLPIPVDERSRFPCFKALMADIGDDQSIEDDLSTFSSHVAHLRRILASADENTLVLIDEAGTGTDPAEGGALAQAVFEVLTERKVRTIATTHHGTLKAFARETPGVENGSMEFDRATLSPTYRFLAGRPGSSYAFEIAERSGLDQAVLNRARALVGDQKSGLEDLIADFETKTQHLAEELAEARKEHERARRERQVVEDRLHKLTAERDEIRGKALEEARRIVGEANAQVERTIREIRESEAAKETTREARQRLESFKESVETVRRQRTDKAAGPAPRRDGGPIEVGDQVVIDGGSTAAEVLELTGRDAVVAQGSMRLRVKAARLTRVGRKKQQTVSVRQVQSAVPVASARSRIDLRGQRVDEALGEVARFVDEAIRTGQSRLEILHGKGTGALRQAIHEQLGTMPEIASFEEAPLNEGGAGVTIVTMR